MFATILFISLLFCTSIAKREKDDRLYDDLNYVSTKYNVSRPTTTGRSLKGEMVVEKFVDTLMASERYLKMVETVEKKISHLDATFHDRTNSILKYLAELLRVVKAPQAEIMEDTLRSLKVDLERLKQSVAEKLAQIPTMRVEGTEYQMESSLDNRLTFLESHMKNIMASVESIASIISEVKTRQNTRTVVRPDVTGSLEAIGLISEFRRALQDQKSRKCDCKIGRVDRIERYPTDCQEIQMQGFNVSGIYKIRPDDMEPFYVLCDLSSAGGGWTVIQNRFDGSQDFYKTWSDYKYGFGNLAGEFWLGLEKLNYLTNQKLYELRIEMESQTSQESFATFSVFTVGPEHEGYRISTLGTYRGNAGDSLSYHAGQKFSTPDVDNDEWKDGTCAVEHGGAWWYKECDKSNLNGKYSPPEDHHGQSIYWISFKGPNSPLAKTRMMIRPLPASRPTDFTDPSRKIMETTKTKPLDKQAARKEKSHDPRHPPYRYEDNLRAEGFFPTYA
ncbi:angiopoietin-related protein 7-like [Pieris napi]|uniref:angiopoietin-related protein 7-like n=1 Tax=Pieris napi TaxID=78633 RepID=UPI001FBAC8F8|nr:angiopoietin-related protein 7-like [Pieris napi]